MTTATRMVIKSALEIADLIAGLFLFTLILLYKRIVVNVNYRIYLISYQIAQAALVYSSFRSIVIDDQHAMNFVCFVYTLFLIDVLVH